jgi:hypothetical protein
MLRYIPHVLIALFFGGLAVVVPRWVDGHPVHAKRAELLEHVEQLQAETAMLRAQNQRLYRQVQTLSTDALSIEQRARDEFFFVYPDEVILDFSPQADGAHGSETAQTARTEP